ncbi:MAG: ribonuclease H family protein [Candidatus Solibacter sp.]|jgi:ribonuclease HI
MNDRRDKHASLPDQDATVPTPIILYTDGGCTGNEQLDASQRVMSAAVSGADGTILVHLTRSGGSNNIAELWAVELALRWAKDNGHKAVEIRTDSTNTLAWVQGRIGRKMNDRNAVLKIWSRINVLRRDVKLTLAWIPREQNLAGMILEEQELTAGWESAARPRRRERTC